MLKITDSKKSAKPSIKVNGKLNIDTYSEFEKNILKRITKDSDLYIDFSGLDYISSVGIRSLIIINKQAKQSNSTVNIIGASGEVKEVINITGLSEIINCCDSFEDITW